MLFFTAEDVDNLRKMSHTTHSKQAARLRRAVGEITNDTRNYHPPKTYTQFAAHWNEIYGNVLPVLALYCVIYPDDTRTFQYLVGFMEQMAEYENWRTLENLKDEVPLAHNVVGYAIALDMIYQRLSNQSMEKFTHKLTNQTRDLYDSAQVMGWGNRIYLQNHVATNVIGVLISGLVCGLHTTEAVAWQKYAVNQWEKSMDIFRLIPDGTSDEGVGYVGYTFRSVIQYVHLAHRHLNFSHFDHPWLAKHFDFYYYSVLPGFRGNLGIADAPVGWFYGPEAHLYFLDRFVMRNGSANWLATQINRYREIQGPAHRFATLHLDYLYYDPHLEDTPPGGHNESELHLYSDWGVVTYRTGPITDASQTYVSFKSAKIHGSTVFDLVWRRPRDPDIKGWRSFNAGHEHPDQNSFTFSPNGKAFITEGLYGPKLPYLDNVHAFYPSNETTCTPMWAGQKDTCSKWLLFKETNSYGEILYTGEKAGVMIAIGNSAHAYSHNLHVRSNFRSVVLLEKDVLLVVDDIHLKVESTLTHVAAFFNNHDAEFSPYTDPGGLRGMSVSHGGSLYKAVWVSQGGQSSHANITSYSGKSIREPSISNANVTFRLEGKSTTMAYLFYGPSNVDRVKLDIVRPRNTVQTSSIVTINVGLGERTYGIDIDVYPRPYTKTFAEIRTRRHTIAFVKDASQIQGKGVLTRSKGSVAGSQSPLESFPTVHNNNNYYNSVTLGLVVECVGFIVIVLVCVARRKCLGSKTLLGKTIIVITIITMIFVMYSDMISYIL